ncbi:hypothetical protein BMS3Bbin02_00017 [bacterium BMS3Bbin02]|nr:hypothetical protein BMS3Bbin02_00017 [bacterium BMS3Bbin02]
MLIEPEIRKRARFPNLVKLTILGGLIAFWWTVASLVI